MFDFIGSFPPGLLALLGGALFVAGCVRGFSGFGAAMIFMPVASTAIAPATAAAVFLIIDGIVALPLVRSAIKNCDWRSVVPAVIGASLTVHFGAWLLANADTLFLRWAIFAIVIGLLTLLMSGWRYPGKPGLAVSVGAGGVGGVIGGVSQVGAPPLLALWLASTEDPAAVRANLIVYFAIASVSTISAYALQGFFTWEVMRLLTLAAPVYGLALYVGSKGFGKSSPTLYRKIAYGLIALAAITSMPALDVLLR